MHILKNTNLRLIHKVFDLGQAVTSEDLDEDKDLDENVVTEQLLARLMGVTAVRKKIGNDQHKSARNQALSEYLRIPISRATIESIDLTGSATPLIQQGSAYDI